MQKPLQSCQMPKPVKTELSADCVNDARPHPAVARVWDTFVRLFHWGLVSSFAIAWFTPVRWEGLHHWAGYVAAALVLARVVWGLAGSHHARFANFVRGPKTTLGYLGDILHHREARFLGHNPAGAAMVLVLMALMVLATLTGWMTTTDRYYGISWVETAHKISVYTLLAMFVLHLGGVILASVRHRENLVRAMFTGRKRREKPEAAE